MCARALRAARGFDNAELTPSVRALAEARDHVLYVDEAIGTLVFRRSVQLGEQVGVIVVVDDRQPDLGPWVTDTTRHPGALTRLTPEEQDLFGELAADTHGDRVWLEQERIGFGWVERALARVALDS